MALSKKLLKALSRVFTDKKIEKELAVLIDKPEGAARKTVKQVMVVEWDFAEDGAVLADLTSKATNIMPVGSIVTDFSCECLTPMAGTNGALFSIDDGVNQTCFFGGQDIADFNDVGDRMDFQYGGNINGTMRIVSGNPSGPSEANPAVFFQTVSGTITAGKLRIRLEYFDPA